MRFLKKSREEIFREARDYLLQNTELRDFKPGSIIRAILDTFSAQLSEQYNTMNMNLMQTYISTAVGDALDNIGMLFGMTRGDAKRAEDRSHANFRFYIDAVTGLTGQSLADRQYTANEDAVIANVSITSSSFTIPAGTVVSAGGIQYRTVEDALFSGITTEVYVPIIADNYGANSNVSAYTLETVSWGPEFTVVKSYVYCENVQDITSGRFLETDDDFRQRIVNAHLNAAKANETAVRLAGLSVPGVMDIKTIEYAAGIGTFAVYVITETPIPSQGILDAVEQAINADKAFGIKAIVTHPDYKGFETRIKIRYSDKTSLTDQAILEQKIRIATELYINNLGLGGEFVANELVQRILEIDDRIVDMNVLTFGIGDYNIVLNLNEDFMPVIFMNHAFTVDEQPIAVPGQVTIC